MNSAWKHLDEAMKLAAAESCVAPPRGPPSARSRATPAKTTKEMFDKEYMLKLEDLGRKMGADPSSWTTEIPSAYRVESDWVKSE